MPASFVKKYLLPAPMLAAGTFLFCLALFRQPEEKNEVSLYFCGAAIAFTALGLLYALFSGKRFRAVPADTLFLLCAGYAFVRSLAAGALSTGEELLLLSGLYFSFRLLLPSGEFPRIWFQVVLSAVALGLSAIALRQALDYQPSNHALFRITSSFFNPGPFGGYLGMILPMQFAVLWLGFRKQPFRRGKKISASALPYLFTALSFLFTLCLFPFTYSRAAFVACAASIAVFLVRTEHRYIRLHRKASLLGAVLLLLGGAAAGYGLYTMKKGSADGRLLIWKISLSAPEKLTLAGTGPGTFGSVYGELQEGYFRSEKRPDAEIRVADAPEYAFNEYLQTGIEYGLPGLALLSALLAAALYRLLRSNDPFGYVLLSFCIFAFFSYPLHILSIRILLIFCLAAAGSAGRGCGLKFPPAAAMLLLLGGQLFLAKDYRTGVRRTVEWQKNAYYYGMGLYREAVERYRPLYDGLSDNPRFLFEYGRALCMTGNYAESIAVLRKGTQHSCDPMFFNIIGNARKGLGEYDEAEAAYRKAHDRLPNRIYPLYLLMTLYRESGQPEKARNTAGEMLRFQEKIESPTTRTLKNEARYLLEAE